MGAQASIPDYPRPWPAAPVWIHLAVSAALLIVAAILDTTRPFQKSLSICYLLPVSYAAWTLRGRTEILVHAAAILTTFLAPQLRSGPTKAPIYSFNRAMGALVGAAMVLLLWERRRYADAVQMATDELEQRVLTRTAELQSMNEKCRDEIALRGQFIRNMSHELRTPMNGIIGMTGLALDSDLSSDQREQLEIVMSCARSLLSLLNDVLDLSKIEAGKFALERAEFPLSRKIEEVCRLLSITANNKGLALHWGIDSDVPDILIGDSHRLGQILLNLMMNAVKFTETGEVSLRVSREKGAPASEADPLRCLLKFSVSDTGIGIAESARGRIFESFWQADGSITRRYGGTGLGLAITSQLVRLMGGSIDFQSELSKGSTFWFTTEWELPPAAPPGAPASIRQRDDPAPVVAASPESAPPSRILVVEDNTVNQFVTVRLLEKAGHQAVVAVNGEDAVNAWRSGSFDLILMDVQMPGMSGSEVTRIIRELEASTGTYTPIIALTAHAMSGDREAFLASGMDGYLAKPVSPEELYRTIREVMRIP